MCFDYDMMPSVFRECHRKARKTHRCCECHLPIHPSETYHEAFGIWDGDPATYRTCATCEWFRHRVTDAEIKAGCRAYEATPAFSFLWSELAEGHDEAIGLIDLNDWHEREERRAKAVQRKAQ